MLYGKWIKNWKSALAENFFLRSAVILLAAALILNATAFRENNRIVIVPPTLNEEFWIERGKASPEYLEQMSVFIATLAGNLSPRSADFNMNTLIKYIAADRLVEVKDDLIAQADYIKKNNITQSFYAESTSIDNGKQSVVVGGDVTRHIGAIKVSAEHMRINIRYKFKDYSVKVADLFVEYPDRKKQDKENDKAAAAPSSVVKGNEGTGNKAEKPADKAKANEKVPTRHK